MRIVFYKGVGRQDSTHWSRCDHNHHLSAKAELAVIIRSDRMIYVGYNLKENTETFRALVSTVIVRID